MCQYNSRCKVQRHRPGTVCPLSGTGGGWTRPTAARPLLTPTRPARVSSGSSRFGSPSGAGGLSLADLFALVLVAKSWDRVHEVGGTWAVVLVCLLLLAPFGLAAWLASRCTAWNGSIEGRCAKVRPRPFQRCELPTHSHIAQPVTAHEVAAVLCFLVGVAGVWAFFTL